MPKAVAVVDGPKGIRFIDQKTGENVDLTTEFIVKEAGPVHFVHCDRCGKRVRLTKTANPSNIIIHRGLKFCIPTQQVMVSVVDPSAASPSIFRQPSTQTSLVSA